MIDREEASVKFDGSDVIESGDTVNKAVPSVVIAEGEIVSEAVVPASVEVKDFTGNCCCEWFIRTCHN